MPKWVAPVLVLLAAFALVPFAWVARTRVSPQSSPRLHLVLDMDAQASYRAQEANPWFADALPVVEGAKSRPVSHQYPQVSDAIRSNMNAYLAGTKTTDTALNDMKSRLQPLYR